MRYLFLLAVLVAALCLPAGSAAFHHGGVPADECAPAQAGTPGSNPTAREAIAKHQTLPIAPVDTPGDAHTPETCPGAPNE